MEANGWNEIELLIRLLNEDFNFYFKDYLQFLLIRFINL